MIFFKKSGNQFGDAHEKTVETLALYTRPLKITPVSFCAVGEQWPRVSLPYGLRKATKRNWAKYNPDIYIDCIYKLKQANSSISGWSLNQALTAR